jgi:hypothetical protein
VDSTDTESDSAVAGTVRLLHRRRGWVWATVVSIVTLLVTLGLLGSLAPNAKGAGQAVAAIFVLLLTALAAVALVASIVDTVRLHRLDKGVRAHAVQRTTHHPVRAHAYRYPPKHRFTWVIGWLVMLVILGLGVATLPGLVDGVAYVTGAEQSVMFEPTAHTQVCGRSGCHTETDGYLQIPGDPSVTWPFDVPVGVPFQVRQPLWNWGLGSELIDGDGGAIGHIVAGIALNGTSVLILFAGYRLTRNWLRHRRQALAA